MISENLSVESINLKQGKHLKEMKLRGLRDQLSHGRKYFRYGKSPTDIPDYIKEREESSKVKLKNLNRSLG
ncbi:MAG: hypothetical protein H6618_06825 [Deltaproteobacteria bacterium]|nr:hypothetical protein [Deltaproteobacteria bacterium]